MVQRAVDPRLALLFNSTGMWRRKLFGLEKICRTPAPNDPLHILAWEFFDEPRV
jgi:hypothetical protein